MVNRRFFVCDYKIDLSSSIIADLFISVSLISKGSRCYNYKVVSFAKSSLSRGRNFSAIAKLFIRNNKNLNFFASKT
jgi:predicted transcriptional regulator